jgi:hypothetical protein
MFNMSTEDKLKNVSPTFGNTVLPAVVGSQTKYQIIYADPAWRLCDGGEIEAEKLNLLLMFNQGTNVCFSTKAPLLQNRCYVPFFFGI